MMTVRFPWLVAVAASPCAAGVCSLDCPPGSIAETEPCGKNTNSGCIVDPPAYEPLTPGTVVCGTMWAEPLVTWDTDWYLVHVEDPDGDGQAMISATLNAESWACAMIFAVSDCPTPFPIQDVGGSGPCVGAGTAAACVDAPGDYIINLQPIGCADGWGNACGSGDRYLLCVTVSDTCDESPAPCPALDPCPWDLDGGGVGITDFLSLLAQWGTDPGGPPDFDGDGNVGITDFLELLANWGPCP